MKGVWKPTLGGNVHVEDELLEALLHLRVREPVVPYEGREVRVEVGEGLGAGGLALQCVKEVHHVAQRAPEVLGGPALHLAGDPAEPAHQQVAQVPAHAVGGQEAQVVDVEIAVHVRVANLGRVDALEPVLGRDGGRYVVVEPLEGIAHVAVFVDAPVGAVQVAFDQLQALGQEAFPLPDLPVLVAVENVCLGDLRVAALDEHFLDQVPGRFSTVGILPSL